MNHPIPDCTYIALILQLKKILTNSLKWLDTESDTLVSIVHEGSCTKSNREEYFSRLSSIRGAATNMIRAINELSDKEADELDMASDLSDSIYSRASVISTARLTPPLDAGRKNKVRFNTTSSPIPEKKTDSLQDEDEPDDGEVKERPEIPRAISFHPASEEGFKKMDTVLQEGTLRKLPLSAASRDPNRVSDKMWKERHFKLTPMKLEWHGPSNMVLSYMGRMEKKGELKLRTHFQFRESKDYENTLTVEVDQQCLHLQCDSYETKRKWAEAFAEAQAIRRTERSKSLETTGVIESAGAVQHLIWRSEDVVDWTGLIDDMTHPGVAASKIRINQGKILQHHTDIVYNCAWSRDGAMVLSAAKESRMIVWDASPTASKSKERIADVNLKGTFTLTCAISPSRRLVAAGGLQENVCICFVIIKLQFYFICI